MAGDVDLAELILSDIDLFNRVMGEYDFETEKLHIDLMAAVNNLHKVTDDEKRRMHLINPECIGQFQQVLTMTS